MSTVKFTGKSEEDAVRKAADSLKLPREHVQYEIVSRSGGLLGLLGQTVTIEVMLGERRTERSAVSVTPGPVALPEPRKEERGPDRTSLASEELASRRSDVRPPPLPGKATTGVQADEPATKTGPQDVPRRAKQGEDHSRGAGNRPERPRRPPRREGKPQDRPRWREDSDEEAEEAVVDPEILESKTQEALDLLKGLLERTDSSREVTAAARGTEIVLTIPSGVPEWMGRGHSPVLDSLQFLLNKSVNRFPPRYRIVVQGHGALQSEERQTELETMARELAQQVIASGVPMWVLPMSPRERRFVHMAIRPMEGVDTESVGSGTTRRIRIFPTAHTEK